MITKQEALTANIFHDIDCRSWRRNGSTKTWKTRPNDFRVPVKFGLYSTDQIHHYDAPYMHLPGTDGCKEAVS